MTIRKLVVALAGAVVLAGCATSHPPSLAPMASSVASPATYFSLRGRISVRVGDRLDPGQIRWNRAPGEERIQLFTPLGSQVAELTRPASGPVTLKKGDETMVAPSVDALAMTMLGVALDLDAVAGWVQGVGLVDGATTEVRMANGDVWQVTAENVRPSGAHRVASRVSAIRGDTVVRLVIDEWSVP